MTGAPPASGTFDRTLALADGGTLRYTVHVPKRDATDPPAALLLVLHYGGVPTPFYGRGLLEQLMLPALARLDAVIAAPETLGGDWLTARNESAVFELLAHLRSTLPLDPARVVATGYSLGAVGTWHLISRHPTVFGAGVPISGLPEEADTGGSTPVFALHSLSDALFPAHRLAQLIEGLAATGRQAQVRFVHDIDHYDVAAFRPAPAALAPWLRQLWARQPASGCC